MSSADGTPPTCRQPSSTPAAVLGAHGGSAASTLARALRLPEVAAGEVPSGAVLVLTARTLATAADDVVAVMAGVRANPVVLALSADVPGPAPAAVRAMRRLLAGRFVAVVELPYVPAWRVGRPGAHSATNRWRAAASQLEQVVTALVADPNPDTEQGDPR